jgi:hypothetical protein
VEVIMIQTQSIDIPNDTTSQEDDLHRLHQNFLIAQENARTLGATLKERQAELDAKILVLETEWRESNAELIANAEAARVAEIVADELLRRTIIAAYRRKVEEYKKAGQEVPNRQVSPALGLSVQVRPKWKITDKQKALAWAREHPDFLIPDEEAIVAAAKEETVRTALKIDFVESEDSISAVVGKPKLKL